MGPSGKSRKRFSTGNGLSPAVTSTHDPLNKYGGSLISVVPLRTDVHQGPLTVPLLTPWVPCNTRGTAGLPTTSEGQRARRTSLVKRL
jgi:hypothetical protein